MQELWNIVWEKHLHWRIALNFSWSARACAYGGAFVGYIVVGTGLSDTPTCPRRVPHCVHPFSSCHLENCTRYAGSGGCDGERPVGAGAPGLSESVGSFRVDTAILSLILLFSQKTMVSRHNNKQQVRVVQTKARDWFREQRSAQRVPKEKQCVFRIYRLRCPRCWR